MSARPCRVAIPVTSCPGSDSPILNISSEAPDQLLFSGMRWPTWNAYNPPPLGGGQYTAANCAGVEFSVGSQEIADLLAQINATICQGYHGFSGGTTNTGDGGSAGNPTTPAVVRRYTAYNTQQSASAGCSSAGRSTYTVNAGEFAKVVTLTGISATDLQITQAADAAVNAQALAFAQQQCSSTRPCISGGPPGNHASRVLLRVCRGEDIAGQDPEFVISVSGNPLGQSTGWSITGGSLPPGISLVVTSPGQAELRGVATVAGYYNFTIHASADQGRYMSDIDVTISVLDFLTQSPLPSGNACTNYHAQIQGLGGKAPYTFAFANNSLPLPIGLNLSISGIISGTTIQSGTFTFTAQITDDQHNICTNDYTLTIGPPLTTPSFYTNATLPTAHETFSYYQPLGVIGGCAPYTITLDSGSLPNYVQLRYSPYTKDSYLSGIPDIGTGSPTGTPYVFTLKATDAFGQTTTRQFTLTVDRDLVLTGSCVNDPLNQATVSVPPNTNFPPGANRNHANEEATNADAVNLLVSHLTANGCTCPPLQVSSDPTGKPPTGNNTTFTNSSATCTIILSNSSTIQTWTILPLQTFNYNSWCFQDHGQCAANTITFDIGGGVHFTVHFSD